MRFLVPPDDEARRHREQVLSRAATDPAAAAQVDSGRLAEPYWYVDSPLTTPDPRRRLAGRPPKGHMPPAVPGVLVPDAPVRVADRPEVTRLRQLVRDGVLALTTNGVDPRAVRAALAAVTSAPVRVYAVADIDVDGAVGEVLEAGDAQIWLIRPDGHIAAVVDDPGWAADAVARLLGHCLLTG